MLHKYSFERFRRCSLCLPVFVICQLNKAGCGKRDLGTTTLSSPVCKISEDPSPCPFPIRWGEIPRMKIRALKPQNRWKTSNVQHRTSNAEVSEDSRCHSMFDVLLASWRGWPSFRAGGTPAATPPSRQPESG